MRVLRRRAHARVRTLPSRPVRHPRRSLPVDLRRLQRAVLRDSGGPRGHTMPDGHRARVRWAGGRAWRCRGGRGAPEAEAPRRAPSRGRSGRGRASRVKERTQWTRVQLPDRWQTTRSRPQAPLLVEELVAADPGLGGWRAREREQLLHGRATTVPDRWQMGPGTVRVRLLMPQHRGVQVSLHILRLSPRRMLQDAQWGACPLLSV